MIKRLINNHALANLTLVLVLVMGFLSYDSMPREQDPSINFNWVNINTALPGASAEDVEKQVTEPLEEALEKVSDVKFISSSSLQDLSSILVRFEDISDEMFRTRLSDVRREIQNKLDELPVAAERPEIAEISTGNAFPTALVMVTGLADDETLRRQARTITEDLDRMQGVWRARALGENEPELQVLFHPEKLVGLGVSPTDLADTVKGYFRDLAAGSLRVGDKQWQIRVEGTANDPQYLGDLPILTGQGEIPLRTVADVVRGRTKASELVRYLEKPSVMIYVAKKADTNILELVERIKDYIDQRNALKPQTGVELVLLDDRTGVIKSSLEVMERNALYGLVLVMLTTWLFLGAKIAFFTGIGIPFILFGTFWFLDSIGQTLNVVVLLGIVISLGMLVDDAIVVVEAIYQKLQRGINALDASLQALSEVGPPVTTAVLTTIAAFMPLMLMPGILGKFMFVVPLVVTTALIISLIEAFWILPAHVAAARLHFEAPSRIQRLRRVNTAKLRRGYVRALTKALRHPGKAAVLGLLPVVFAVLALAFGLVRTEFFASEPYRFFYVNILMPPGTDVHKTMQTTLAVERAVRETLDASEVRGLASYAGLQFSEMEPYVGERYGQVFVNVGTDKPDKMEVDQLIELLREKVITVPGPLEVSFLRRTGGPPTTKPVSVKVRGDDPSEVRRAADKLIDILTKKPAVTDIGDDDDKGRMELSLRLNPDAIVRARLDPISVLRTVKLLSDGEVAASMRYQGDKVDVRVRAAIQEVHAIDNFLHNTISLGLGKEIAIKHLLDSHTNQSQANIRHYNLRRAITVEAGLDKSQMDTVAVNRLIQKEWEAHSSNFPGVHLDFSGELDDIQQSLNSIFVLFLLGLGLIYLILATQFRSYLQPLYIVAGVPMAFAGVVFGLLISGHPLSMYTLYGMVALAGIAVNAAIVLISSANNHIEQGMSVIHAAVYAARRRVVPVIVTTATTMAGLFSLAFGLGGASLMWGPVATSIFWGLAFSTLLTLFMIPLIYANFTAQPKQGIAAIPPLRTNAVFSWHPGALLEYLAYRVTLFGGKEEGFLEILEHPLLSNQYHEAVQFLNKRQYDKAIKAFEQMAENQPDNASCNVFAAQALTAHMQEHGWDIGYDARARRYLGRAASLTDSSKRLAAVKRAFEALSLPDEQRRPI